MATHLYPNSPEAAQAIREINAEVGGVVDAHHHLWDQVNTARPGAALLNVDLAKFGIAEKLVRPPPAPPSRRPTASDVEIKKKLAGAIKQYGTVQEQLMDYLPEDLIADSVQESGVTLLGTVYLQCGWTDTSPGGQAGETAWADSVAKKTSGVVGTGIIGAINMTAPVEITERELLAHMKASPNFRGIRDMELARPRSAKELLTDPRVLANLKLFEKYNLVLDVTCYQWSLPALVEVANMFPRNTFVFDHMGPPVNILKNPNEWSIWLSGITAVSKCPNVFVKLSCLMPVIGSDLHLRRVNPYIQAGATASEIASSGFGRMIRETLKLFGPARCMWASNYPSDKPSARFGELAACTWMIMKELGIDQAGRRMVMRGTAVRAYRLALPAKGLIGDGRGVDRAVARI